MEGGRKRGDRWQLNEREGGKERETEGERVMEREEGGKRRMKENKKE